MNVTIFPSPQYAGDDVVEEVVRLLRYDSHSEEQYKSWPELTHRSKNNNIIGKKTARKNLKGFGSHYTG